MKLPFRLRYFLSHLLISLLVASCSLLVIFKVWYPTPLHTALGISGLVVMMLAIDVILGPLLTLMLAKEGKKELKTDLMIIGIIQLSALFYGLYSINKGRPVAIVFDINRFELVQKHMITSDTNQAIIKQYANHQNTRVPVASVRPPKDIDELAERMQTELDTALSSTARAELYEPLQKNIDIIIKEMKPMSDLARFNDETLAKQIVAKYPQADGFLPLIASSKNITVLIDSKNKTVVSIIDARPW